MILKSLSRRSNSFAQLIKYIIRDDEIDEEQQMIWQHNVFGKSVDEIEREFLENESFRLNQSLKNPVKLFHDIISFSEYDNLTPEILEDFCRSYIQERNINGLYFASPHMEKSAHIHLLVSAVQTNGENMRISKKRQMEIKEVLETLQREKYPQLSNSLVEHGKKSERSISDAEVQMEKRGVLSYKKMLEEKIVSIYKECTTKEMLMERLTQEGIETYTRGKNIGVVAENGRRWRLNNFLGSDWEQEISKVSENLKSLEDIRGRRSEKIKEPVPPNEQESEPEEVIQEEILTDDTENDQDSSSLDDLFEGTENTIEKILKIPKIDLSSER